MKSSFKWFLLGTALAATTQLGLLPLFLMAFKSSTDNMILAAVFIPLFSPCLGVALSLLVKAISWIHEAYPLHSYPRWKDLVAERGSLKAQVSELEQKLAESNGRAEKGQLWEEALQNKDFANGIMKLIEQLEAKPEPESD